MFSSYTSCMLLDLPKYLVDQPENTLDWNTTFSLQQFEKKMKYCNFFLVSVLHGRT